jgi:hypothetical protein
MKKVNGGHGNNGGALTEAPVKRGPGRPRKQVTDAIQATESAPVKRGPVRGKASTMTTIDVSKLMVEPKVMELTIKGLTPLLVHNFGAKAIKQILDKQTGEAKTIKAKKDPFADFLESLYVIDQKKVPKTRLAPGGEWKYVPNAFGFPASAFKKAMVAACSFVDGIPKTWVRGLIHVHGDLLPIEYKALVMQQDTVRVGPFGRKVADIRFRGRFDDWKIRLRISYNANAIKPAQIAMLLNNAGFSVGIGEWRPEKDGSYGTFAIS